MDTRHLARNVAAKYLKTAMTAKVEEFWNQWDERVGVLYEFQDQFKHLRDFIPHTDRLSQNFQDMWVRFSEFLGNYQVDPIPEVNEWVRKLLLSYRDIVRALGREDWDGAAISAKKFFSKLEISDEVHDAINEVLER